jgi:hypothetical protein
VAGIGSTPSLLLGFAVGEAASAAFEPALEIPKQEAWQSAPNRVLDPDLLAALVAQGGVDLSTAHALSVKSGHAAANLDALTYLAQTVPGIAEALHLWRLGFISDGLMEHVLVKEGLDSRYVQPILNTKIEELIGLGDIAISVVRGILPAPSYVPVPVPAQGDKVPRYPQVNIDPEVLAAKIGYSPQALEIMVGRSGLSLAPVMAAQALFRGLITENDFLIAIGEGDLRTEWATTVRDAARQILTAGEYAELQLRGFLTADQRRANTQKHGMSDADSDLLYDVLGRAPAVHAITTGLARGGVYKGDSSNIPEVYLSAMQRSNARPEYYSIEYANRYVYPSAFVLRALAQAGDLGGQAEVEQVLLEVGWKPSFAQQVSTAWTGGATSGDPHEAKAQTQLWTTTHRSYVAEEIDDAVATAALGKAGVAAAAIPAILALWAEERSLVRKQLSPTQIRKALNLGVVNPATGVAWTTQDAIDAMLARGYDLNDATVFLQE